MTVHSALGQGTAIAAREVKTVLRTRIYALLAVGLFGFLFVLVAGGGGAATGYTPAVVDLLLPLEVIVPVLAVAIGYRSVVADLDRGELAVFTTYDVPAPVYVTAVYLGRSVGILGMLGIPLVATGGVIAFTATPDTGVFATHSGVDSPVLFGRFVVLTALYGLSMLSLVLLGSVIARSLRTAIALAIGAVLVAVVGGDAAILAGLTDGSLGSSSLSSSFAAVPNSAYRSLVLETVISIAAPTEGAYGSPAASAIGLVSWIIGPLFAAAAIVARKRL